MTAAEYRALIKKSNDAVPAAHLKSLADFAAFLTRPSLRTRLTRAKRAITSGKGTPWHSARIDV